MDDLFIGDFRIDVKRSEVIHQKNKITLEPKVLKVLLVLAEKPGEIVARQKLLDDIWPDVIVETNTLQRCIAQLRKAFNDDAKSQNFISTHPRRGYSLVAEVKWQSKIAVSPPKKNFLPLNSNKLGTFSVILSIFLLFAFFQLWQSKEYASKTLNVSKIKPITATDATEYRASFSPDGQYLAFQRYVDKRTSHIWVKDLSNNSEYQLTKNAAIYGKAEWSPDGSQIALRRESTQIEQRVEKKCHTITRLSFALAKSSPQPIEQLFPCVEQMITALSWLTDSKIVYLQGLDKNNPVLAFDLVKKEKRILYQEPNRINHGLAFSLRNNQIALLQGDRTQLNSLVLFDVKNHSTKEVKLNFPKGYDTQYWSGLNWHPHEDSLLVANNHALIKLSLDGKFVEYPMMTYQRIFDPVYHPSGKQIAATLGLVDFDIAELHWGLSSQEDKNKTDKSIYRSTVNDSGAKYRHLSDTSNQVNRESSFISNRSGNYQLWFDNSKQLQQLTQAKEGERIGSSVWSSDGNLIAVEINHQLHLLNLNGKTALINESLQLERIYQWVGNNQLLVKSAKDKQTEITLFDVSNEQSAVLFHGEAVWAQLDSHQNLYLSDNNGAIFRVVDGKKVLITELKDNPVHKTFFIKADMIFFNNGNGEFWQFNLSTKKKALIAKRNVNAVRLEDVDIENKRLLYLNYIQGRKEIVLLH